MLICSSVCNLSSLTGALYEIDCATIDSSSNLFALRAEENSIHPVSRQCTDTIHSYLGSVRIQYFQSCLAYDIWACTYMCVCPTRNPTTLVCGCCYFCCTLQHTLLPHAPHTVNPACHREISYFSSRGRMIFWAKKSLFLGRYSNPVPKRAR